MYTDLIAQAEAVRETLLQTTNMLSGRIATQIPASTSPIHDPRLQF